MPRYHFNVLDDVSMPDSEGQELTDLASARCEAVKLCGSLIRELDADFWDGEEWKMEVTNDRGLILFSLLFIAVKAPGTLI